MFYSEFDVQQNLLETNMLTTTMLFGVSVISVWKPYARYFNTLSCDDVTESVYKTVRLFGEFQNEMANVKPC